jgi:hypothetical protein
MEPSIKTFMRLFIASAKYKLYDGESINMTMMDNSDKSNLIIYIYNKFKNIKADYPYNSNLIITHNGYKYNVSTDKYLIGICKTKI